MLSVQIVPEPRHVSSYDAPPSPTCEGPSSGPFRQKLTRLGRILGSSDGLPQLSIDLSWIFPFQSMPGVWPESKLSSSTPVCQPRLFPRSRSERPNAILASNLSIILPLNACQILPWIQGYGLTSSLCTNLLIFHLFKIPWTRPKTLPFQNRHR
jgi:hypothetical protein